MKKRKTPIHMPSLLIGILIGAVALFIVLVALPGPRTGARPAASSTGAQLQVDLNRAAVQVKDAWGRMLASLGTHNTTAPVGRSCLQFRTWFNQLDDRLVGFLALHGLHLPRWQVSMKLCASAASGPG